MTKGGPLSPTVRTAMIMGLPFSVHLRGSSRNRGAGPVALEVAEPGNSDVDAAVEAVWAELRWADRVFSTYREDSDVSRIRRGELRVRDADPAVAKVLNFGEIARRLTAGAFDVNALGVLDPSGIVKGWAAVRAADALAGLGLDYYLGAGGDVLLRSRRPEVPWRIGIEHPDDPRGLLAVVELPVGGVATSGQAHRGNHIWNPVTGRPARGIAQATVVGPSLVWADVLATAVVAGGPERLDHSSWPPGYEVLLVTDEGAVMASPGFRSCLAPDVPAPPLIEFS